MTPKRFWQFFLISGLTAPWLVSLVLPLLAGAQETLPCVTFTLNFPGTDPDHYVISVSSDGHAVYDSNGKINAQAEVADPFRFDFTLSEATRNRIFDLAKRAHYFEGTLDSGRKNIASTGTKTLSYKDAHQATQATYNYSPNPAVTDLTQIFQNLSTTLEFGHRLEYYHRYQKLALDDELKRMEELSKQNQLQEIPVAAPILQQIVNDPSVMNVVRARAQRLLATTTNK